MEEDDSAMFKVDRSGEYQAREMVFFNQKTEIIAEGQRHRVVFGQMEEQKKTFHEIVSPYLHKFAQNTAQLAAKAGATTYEALKTGLLWVYNKFVDQVIPYAVQNLPKVLFVTQKRENRPITDSGLFEVIGVDEEQYKHMGNPVVGGKRRVVIPLGTQNDAHFQQFLQNQKYEVSYQFPIDEDSQIQECQARESFLIPSQSYEAICQEVQESHAQLQLPIPVDYKKKVIKMPNCFIFQFQGQNTIEYDLLDSIGKNNQVQPGYLVFPEETLRRSLHEPSIPSEELDVVGQLVQDKEPPPKQWVEEDYEVKKKPKSKKHEKEQQLSKQKGYQVKKVDNERRVQVQVIHERPRQVERC